MDTSQPGRDMEIIDVQAVEQALSLARVAPYKASGTTFQAILRHQWNASLSRAAFSSLQCLELGLRNSMNRAIGARMGRADWYKDCWLRDVELKKVADAERAIALSRIPVTPDAIVAKLSFGFWCSLFNRHYETNRALWPSLVKTVFPRLSKGDRDLRLIESRLNTIREFRNRVSHHEPVWKRPDLLPLHGNVMTMIRGLSPELASLCRAFDPFPHVLKKSFPAYEMESRLVINTDSKGEL